MLDVHMMCSVYHIMSWLSSLQAISLVAEVYAAVYFGAMPRIE